MNKEGYDQIVEAVAPLGGEVYPEPVEGENRVDVEIYVPILPSEGRPHPTDTTQALREQGLMAEDGSRNTRLGHGPQLILRTCVVGDVLDLGRPGGYPGYLLIFEDVGTD
jgi:hypothetical protein